MVCPLGRVRFTRPNDDARAIIIIIAPIDIGDCGSGLEFHQERRPVGITYRLDDRKFVPQHIHDLALCIRHCSVRGIRTVVFVVVIVVVMQKRFEYASGMQSKRLERLDCGLKVRDDHIGRRVGYRRSAVATTTTTTMMMRHHRRSADDESVTPSA